MITGLIILLSAAFLAFANGSNDNFKGVSTLYGSGTTSFRSALNWGTITTAAGCVAAIIISQGLVKNFSGKGLIPDEQLKNPDMAIAVALGAACTVFLATRIGIPMSTTHAIVGSLVGVGLITAGGAFQFSVLKDTFLLPLLLSPIIAAVLSIIVYLFFRFMRIRMQVDKETYITVTDPAAKDMGFSASTIRVEQKREGYSGNIVGISAQKILDFFHYISAGSVGFARGLNDAPKIAGLLLLVNLPGTGTIFILVAVIMAAGGLLNAKRVGMTMSKKITYMNPGQGFTANLITALLVTTASVNGLPVSTTHVSVGSIFGIGAVNKRADYRVVGKIASSWILTLPVAALISSVIFILLRELK